jgi:hypothetical protein
MKNMLIGILKKMFSENVLRAIVLALGDHLVHSSKNKLDNAIWDQVKKRLG